MSNETERRVDPNAQKMGYLVKGAIQLGVGLIVAPLIAVGLYFLFLPVGLEAVLAIAFLSASFGVANLISGAMNLLAAHGILGPLASEQNAFQPTVTSAPTVITAETKTTQADQTTLTSTPELQEQEETELLTSNSPTMH